MTARIKFMDSSTMEFDVRPNGTLATLEGAPVDIMVTQGPLQMLGLHLVPRFSVTLVLGEDRKFSMKRSSAFIKPFDLGGKQVIGVKNGEQIWVSFEQCARLLLLPNGEFFCVPSNGLAASDEPSSVPTDKVLGGMPVGEARSFAHRELPVQMKDVIYLGSPPTEPWSQWRPGREDLCVLDTRLDPAFGPICNQAREEVFFRRVLMKPDPSGQSAS